MFSLISFGNSITAGYAVTSAQLYINRISDSLSAYLKNYAANSAMAADQLTPLANDPPGGDITTVMLGTVDTSIYGNSTNATERRKNFINCLRTIAVYSSGVPLITTEKMTLTGTWNLGAGQSSLKGGGWSSDNTATATATVSGTSVYICYDQFTNPSNNSVFEVWIDGTLIETVTLDSAKLINTYLGKNLEPVTIRYNGLSNTTHTVLLKNKSNPKVLQLNFIAGSAPSPAGLKKPVFFMNIPFKTIYDPSDSAANITSYNSDIATMITQLRADGLNSNLVDIASTITSSDIHSDGVHLLSTGHDKVYNQLLASIISNAYPTTGGGGTTYTYPAAGHQILTGKTVDVFHNGSGGYNSITVT